MSGGCTTQQDRCDISLQLSRRAMANRTGGDREAPILTELFYADGSGRLACWSSAGDTVPPGKLRK